MSNFLTKGTTSNISTEWETPKWLFDKLNSEYQFTLDAAATQFNAKCDTYCTKEGTYYGLQKISDLDGLDFPWNDYRVFLNPPWGREIVPFVRKCSLSANLVVAILPSRTDTKWFHNYVLPFAKIEWLKGRVNYINPETELPAEAPPVGTFIAKYGVN